MQEHVQRQSGRSMRVGPTLMSKGSSVCVSLAQLGVCRRMRGLPPHSGHGIVPARIGEGNGLLLRTDPRQVSGRCTPCPGACMPWPQ